MEDSDLMPFGKYKGKEMQDVPASYLLYLYNEVDLYGKVKDYIEENMDVLKEEVKNDN
jgi:uncharacterized protein (DUF3820 family)